ncbi:MAG: 30S ribosomal protein S12 methylthiotransferase RimO [Candidatus Muiribacteriota bacterium]|jgi:ribosomal protein S12 methylthiotransferase
MIKIYIEKLGCAKNNLDAELIESVLVDKKFKIVNNPLKSDVIIINTCTFIESAKKESIDVILEFVKLKMQKPQLKIIVSGCLSQRYSDELIKEIPELDGIIGVYGYEKIYSIIEQVFKGKTNVSDVNSNPRVIYDSNIKRITKTRYTAELKIADGCNNRCSYCVIPDVRGDYQSKRFEKCVEEAYELAQQGVKEIILIAQEITKYGVDLYSRYRLTELIESISEINGIEWIRLMYLSINDVDEKFLNFMKNNKKLLHYVDIPVQNVNSEILKKMNRQGSYDEITEKINEMRETIPDICIRSTLITGFPGETEEIFRENLKWVKTIKIDRLGVFKYSHEENTPAYELDGQIEEEIKDMRVEKLMLAQMEVSREINQKFIENEMNVLVEGFENNVYVGRTYRDAPEIDGYVFIENIKPENNIKIGDIIKVKITSSGDYDLYGELA